MTELGIVRAGVVAALVCLVPAMPGQAASEAEAQEVISQLRQSLYQAVKDRKDVERQRDEAHARVTRLDAELGPLAPVAAGGRQRLRGHRISGGD